MDDTNLEAAAEPVAVAETPGIVTETPVIVTETPVEVVPEATPEVEVKTE